MTAPAAAQETGRGLGLGMWLLFWLCVLGLGIWFFGKLPGFRENPNGAVTGTYEQGVAEVRLAANLHGHYLADGLLNGKMATLLVDTGATNVVVPAAWAQRFGLDRGPRVRVHTANGEADAWLTHIARLQLGSLEFHNVEAHLTQGLDNTILLGMSVLSDVEFAQQNGELVLRQSR